MANDANQVMIIGAGPVGMTMAAHLARFGVGVRIVDKRAGPVEHSHASVVHTRTREMFDAMGIAEDFNAQGHRFEELSFHALGRHLATVRLFGVDGDQDRGPLDIGQDKTERILIAHLAALGVVVERPVEAVAVEQDAGSCRVTLRHPDGREEIAEAAYVCGCEGSNSIVRKTADIPFEGERYTGFEFVQTDARVHASLVPGRGYVFINHDRFLGLFPFDGKGLYRVLCARPDQDATDTSDPTLLEMENIVRDVVDPQATLSDPLWLNRFRTQHRVAGAFRAGARMFIAGDAGHVHVPVAGQGMNTGMQDAFNLSWKLASVIRGWAPASLLDSYDAERQPKAERLINFTDGGFRRLVTPNAATEAAIRLLGASFLNTTRVQDRLRAAVEEVDLHYRGGALAESYDGSGGVLGGDRVPDAQVVRGPGRRASRIQQLFRGTHWTALFLAGKRGDAHDLIDIADELVGIYGERIKAFVITPTLCFGNGDAALVELVHDVDDEAHHAFGVSDPTLILVRPDWYVGLRCSAHNASAIENYLAKVLIATPSAVAA
ncbi:FAD-dependent monooxygenase [Sandaracinobacteroides saxicola]|uniref:FAD-dependent monooxygenase n=1 Tax=Sandaracinobacteroides saxicola TaxID=2759707 RepID=A0A7G5IE09_9SPHN|nr:FAD-dependent monooxygenase [Sandaracinobacteroides saxicola]QMW21601.1 FAD-dependent monooxygenase [Sandaracinobacteroides saxicola]